MIEQEDSGQGNQYASLHLRWTPQQELTIFELIEQYGGNSFEIASHSTFPVSVQEVDAYQNQIFEERQQLDRMQQEEKEIQIQRPNTKLYLKFEQHFKYRQNTLDYILGHTSQKIEPQISHFLVNRKILQDKEDELIMAKVRKISMKYNKNRQASQYFEQSSEQSLSEIQIQSVIPSGKKIVSKMDNVIKVKENKKQMSNKGTNKKKKIMKVKYIV